VTEGFGVPGVIVKNKGVRFDNAFRKFILPVGVSYSYTMIALPSLKNSLKNLV
jgi:hypothetical protein